MKTLLPLALVLVAVGCNATIVDGDGEGGGGGGDTCEDEAPPSDGWCPPVWECVDGSWVDYGGACPYPECPEWAPSHGSSCEAVGQTCQYEEEFDCGGEPSTVHAECTADGWSVITARCLPEPFCPDEAPLTGTDCSEYGEDAYDCWYPVGECEDTFVSAYCDVGTGLWQASIEGVGCGCDYASPASCEAAEGCRYAVPGCGENPIPFEGCIADGGCPEAGCPLDEECATVDIDPCWASDCNACSAPIETCIPSMGGADQ